MTCEHTRQRLSELPVDRFEELSAHLSICQDCRQLAEAIITREEHVVRYVEEYLRADTFESALAAARAVVPATRAPVVAFGRWASGALIALAAAAAFVLALPGPMPPEGERDLAAPPPVTVPPDRVPPDRIPVPDAVHLGVGRTAVLALEQSARSLSMADPTVAAIAPLGRADRLRITGERPGRTLLHAALADGADHTWWIEVHTDPTAPVVSDAAEVLAIEE